MLMLAMRTDKPVAELYLVRDGQEFAQKQWEAHRELSDTLHLNIGELLKVENCTLTDLDRIAIYEGPGSFTGLRIGFSVANALGYGLGVPVVTASSDNWLQDCVKDPGKVGVPVAPNYGQEANITQQKK